MHQGYSLAFQLFICFSQKHSEALPRLADSSKKGEDCWHGMELSNQFIIVGSLKNFLILMN